MCARCAQASLIVPSVPGPGIRGRFWAGSVRKACVDGPKSGPQFVAALWLGYKIIECLKDWKSVIFGVWVAPGAVETLQKGGGRRPSPFARVSKAPEATQTSQNYRFPIHKQFKNLLIKPKCSHDFPGLAARVVLGRVLARSRQLYGKHRPKIGAGSPARRPEAR